jgi:HSP20 family molecular chaperone IbpA
VDAAVWEPPVDIHETSDGLSLQFALPGIAVEQIEVTVEPKLLTVSARRPLAIRNGHTVIRRLEIPHGHFVRRVPLPGRMQVAETRYVNGLLEVRLTWAAANRE